MDKTIYQSKKEETKRKYKELKNQYKNTRPSFKKRVGKILHRVKYSFVVAYKNKKKKIGNKIHKKRNAIKELNVKLDYIVDSLKGTLNTTDAIRKKTIDDIITGIDKL